MALFGMVAGLVLIFALIDFYDHSSDTTDRPRIKGKQKRRKSGLRVYIDNATGVHYIKSHPFDRLHVRIKADGTPYTEADEV